MVNSRPRMLRPVRVMGSPQAPTQRIVICSLNGFVSGVSGRGASKKTVMELGLRQVFQVAHLTSYRCTLI